MKWILVVFLAVFVALAALPAVAADQNTVSWQRESSANEQGFNVYRKSEVCTGSLTLTKLATVPTGTLTYVDTAVTEGTTYCYGITAYNTAGESPMSNTAGRLVPFVVPSSPAGVTVGP